MDEATLRTLLDGALAGEPPIGPFADKALQAGIKVRRRRVLSAAGSMAAAAAIAVAIPVVAGPLGTPPASRQHPPSGMGLNAPANVPLPDKSVRRWRALAKDRASVVKITGDAAATCNRSMRGSGFVISPRHVLTNAHVVAGMTNGPYVSSGTGDMLAAKVVLFDWSTDVAILYVPHLNAPPLRFTGPAPQGSDAAVAGYPKNGAFQAVPARIGYDNGSVTVNIYAVRATLTPGNSGGPLLAKSGKVYGVMLSAGSAGRGFALAASAVGPDVRYGARATTPVSTHGCPGSPTASPAPQSPP